MSKHLVIAAGGTRGAGLPPDLPVPAVTSCPEWRSQKF